MTINPNGRDYSYSVIPNPATTGSSSNPYTDTTIDQNVIANASGLTVNNAIVAVTDSAFAPGHSFSSLTPSTCSVNLLGNVTYVSNGTCKIKIKVPTGNTTYQQTMIQTGSGSTTYAFASWKTQSLSWAITNAVFNMYNGLTAGYATRNLWNSNNYGFGINLAAGRNEGCITAGLDLSSIPVSTAGGTDWKYPGVLISNRHLLCAAHQAPSVGSNVYTWLAEDEQTYYTAGVSAVQVVYNLSTGIDIAVVYLDTAISSTPYTGIPPMAVLPANWANYLPAVAKSNILNSTIAAYPPAFFKGLSSDGSSNPTDGIRIFDWTYNTASGNQAIFVEPADPIKQAWWNPITSSDASGPFFIPFDPLNGSNYQAVLIGLCSTSGAVGNVADYITQINSAMTTLAGSSYTLTTVSLSNYPTSF
jgi:hypothetical protein